jgi:hypothetical protein
LRRSKSSRPTNPFLHHKPSKRTRDSRRYSAAQTLLKTITVKPYMACGIRFCMYPLAAVPIWSVHRRNPRGLNNVPRPTRTAASNPPSLTLLLTPSILALQFLPTCDPAIPAGGHHHARPPSTDVPRAGVGYLDMSCTPGGPSDGAGFSEGA